MEWLQQMLMPAWETEADATFRAGDDVVVAEVTFQCTPGVFLRLTDDANLAEIKEYNGIARSHPVIWIRHSRAFHVTVKGSEISAMTREAA